MCILKNAVQNLLKQQNLVKDLQKKKVCTLTQTVLLFLKTELMCKMFSSDACGSLSIFFHNEQGNMSARMITTDLTDTHLPFPSSSL